MEDELEVKEMNRAVQPAQEAKESSVRTNEKKQLIWRELTTTLNDCLDLDSPPTENDVKCKKKNS